MQKWILIVVAVLVFGSGGWYFVNALLTAREAGKEESQPTFEVALRTISENIEANGIVEPKTSVEVRSEISGRIEKIYVTEGDFVERGQVLVELDRMRLINDVREAERNLESARLRMNRSRRDFIRLESLKGRDFARESEFEDAQTEYELANIEMEVRQTRLETAQENLDQATILAPQSGVLSEVDITEGQVIVGATSVNQGTVLMKVNDMAELIVKANINEVDVMRIDPDVPVRIRFDSIPDLTIRGTITEISRFGRSENNIRVFPVEVTFPAEDPRLRSGITANLIFPIARAENVPSVILSAVFRVQGQTVLVVREESGEFEMREVVTGLSDNRFVEIKEGVEPGEVISLRRPPGMERVMGQVRGRR